jgi:NRPS condensation-like uncharacterized protein
MTDQPPQKPRHGSEKRQRNKITPIRWASDEFNKVAAKADKAGLTFGAFIRALGLGDAGPRARRSRPINDQVLVRVIGLHGKYGNNMNQIAYKLNANAQGALAADFEGALREWAEIRDLMFEAFEMEPSEDAPIDLAGHRGTGSDHAPESDAWT